MHLNYLNKYGAPGRVRTRDPLITNQVLYQLSYKGIGQPSNRFCAPVKRKSIPVAHHSLDVVFKRPLLAKE